MARLLLRPVVPKQGRQLLARVSLIRTEGQNASSAWLFLLRKATSPPGSRQTWNVPKSLRRNPPKAPPPYFLALAGAPHDRFHPTGSGAGGGAKFYRGRYDSAFLMRIDTFLTLTCRGIGRPCDGPWLR